MLNKELLMAGITMKEPHILLTVGRNGGIRAYMYGYTRGYSVSSNNIGCVSKIPYWGDVSKNISLKMLYGSRTKSNNSVSTWINWWSNFTFNRLVATRLDTGKSVEFVTNSAYAEVTGVALFTESDVGREIPLSFAPPPPPPTGTSIQTHPNRTRVLRRRRSSLGGSRC